MLITNLDKVEKVVPKMEGADKVLKQVPLSREQGAPNFSFRVFTIGPGGHTPHHRHPFEHMNYIMEGEGILVNEGKEYIIKQGDFALVAPGEMHQFKNPSTSQSLVFICAVPKEFE